MKNKTHSILIPVFVTICILLAGCGSTTNNSSVGSASVLGNETDLNSAESTTENVVSPPSDVSSDEEQSEESIDMPSEEDVPDVKELPDGQVIFDDEICAAVITNAIIDDTGSVYWNLYIENRTENPLTFVQQNIKAGGDYLYQPDSTSSMDVYIERSVTFDCWFDKSAFDAKGLSLSDINEVEFDLCVYITDTNEALETQAAKVKW